MDGSERGIALPGQNSMSIEMDATNAPAEVQNALRGGCHVASHYFDLVAGEVVERHPSERNTSRMLLDEAIQPSRC